MSKTCMVFLAAVVVALAACGGEMPASDGGTDGGGDVSDAADGAALTATEMLLVGQWQRTTVDGYTMVEEFRADRTATVTVSWVMPCGMTETTSVDRTWMVDASGALVLSASATGCTTIAGCGGDTTLAGACRNLDAGGTFDIMVDGTTLRISRLAGGEDTGTYTRQ